MPVPVPVLVPVPVVGRRGRRLGGPARAGAGSGGAGDAELAAALASTTAHLSRHLVGKPFGAVGVVPPTGNQMVDHLTKLALASLHDGLDHEADGVFVGGAARMAAAFDAVGTIRQVLTILEQQFVLVTLLQDVLDRGLSVAIGTEHGIVPLADCSVVVAPYQIEGEPAGTVGVLGPTRMRYDQALAAVAVVSQRLGKALNRGLST